MEYRQLRKHPRFSEIWNTSYFNETEYLCQGIGKGTEGKNVTSASPARMDTFHVIAYVNSPTDWCKDVTYNKVVCKIYT